MAAAGPAPIALSVLGPIRAARGGLAVDLGGPRQRSVVARLAIARGHVVSTDRLIDDLWEGEPPPKALATLQVHVSHLRRALEPGRPRRSAATVLVSAAPGYALALSDDAVDAWAFEALVGRARGAADPATRRQLLARALACWTGPAYAEVADTSWAAPEIARLDELRLVAFEEKADADLALGQAAALVPDLERHLHDHPTREDAVRLLSLALYRSGRQADALAVLRRTRAHLADELGVDPGPALRALEAAVLAHAPSLAVPAPAVTVPRPARPDPPPGTEEPRSPAERRVLAAIEGRATAGVVWVAGEAGAGKTTIAEAVTGRLRSAGWQTAWGRCPEVDGAPPAWAWSEVVGSIPVPDQPAPALAALRADQPAEGGPGDAFWLARAVAGQVAKAAEQAPVLLVLDDVHRADGLTLQLLRRLLDEVAALPVVVLATYRDSEADERLAATRAALAVTSTHHEALTGLDDAAIARLARGAGLPLVDDEVVALLRGRTGGNPLFVRELARLMAAEGLPAGREGVPTGVGDVLRRRIARLPGPAVTVLRQAAVLGREVDVDVLAEVAGRDPDEVIDALETAVLAGLLDEPAPGQVRFTHALVRDTLYADTPVLRRTRLHAAALDVLSARHADAATLAHHAVASAGTASARSAIGYVVAAARAAEALGASAEAARHWATAVRLHDLAGAPADESLIDLLLPSIAAHARAGDTETARAQQETAVRTATRLDRSELLVAALAAWDAPLVWRVREQSRQNPALLRPLRALLDPARGTALRPSVRIALLTALFREVEGEDDELALEASAEALALARAGDDPRRLCEALNARAYAALGPDLIDEREELASELHAVATRAGLVEYQAVAHWLLFLAAAARTDLTRAKNHADQAVALSSSGQFAHLLGVLGIFSGVLLVLAGRFDEGRERYEAVAARLAEAGLSNGALMAMIGRFTTGFARGDLSDAVADAEWLHRAMPGILTEMVVLCLLDAGREADARAAWQLRAPANNRDHYWLVVTALRAHAATRLGDVGEAVAARDALLPYAGRIAGLDSGSMPVGPVDDALAAVAELVGDGAGAAAHRAGAAVVRERVAAELRTLGY